MSVTTGLQLPYGIQPVNPVPVDAWSGPFTGSLDTVESARDVANASIPSAIRFQSMEVRLIVEGISRKFWYRAGIEDVDLVEFLLAKPGGEDTQVQFNDGGIFEGDANFTFDKSTSSLKVNSLSGSLTKLSDGTSFLVAGSGIQITSGSSGAVTITSYVTGTAGGTITSVSPGLGLTGGGSIGDVSLAIDDSLVATVSGSTFTGVVKFNSGISGSLTSLTDGSPYLLAGQNVAVATNPNGSITISSTATGANTVTLTKWMEFPAGDIDGMNMVFTLSSVPSPSDSLMLYVNGVLQNSFGGDYLLSSNSIVMNYAPIEGSSILATYLYQVVLPTGPSVSWMENPEGIADGINTTFSLAHPPFPATSLMFYVSGILQKQGEFNDYSLIDNTVSMNYIPASGSIITATYAYKLTLPKVGSDINWMEVPAGDLDGINYTFTLANEPLPSDAIMFYVNGVLQRQGPLYDYTFSVSNAIIMNYIPYLGSNIAVTYPYDKALVTGMRPKYYSNVMEFVPANYDVSFFDGNLDIALPSMSLNNFLNDYDVYLNGTLLRPGNSFFAVNDYYQGSDLLLGQIRFKFDLNEGDVLCLIPVISN